MTLTRITQNALCSVLVLLQIVAFPSLSLAQEAASETPPPATIVSEPTPAPAANTTTPTSGETAPTTTSPTTGATTTGTASPTGADSKTYTINPDGTWTNGTYNWSPVTKQSSPVTPQEYSFNPTTGRWDTTEYIYSPETGTYVPNVVSVASNPNADISGTGPQSINSLANGSALGSSLTNTGPNSTNTIDGTTNLNGTFDLFFNGAISNNISSNATSGNALVQGNTMGGSALSGDASAMANLINMLQSSWLGSSEIASFISNINGNVYGDLLIDPNQLPQTLGSQNSDVDVNISNNGAIDNNIDLVARSGDATVTGNTKGGDAISGDARAMANILNLINSSINAGQSFLGMININGNFDGDILLPAGLLDALISNTGSNSTNTIGDGTSTSDTDINSTTNRTINNNINSTAASGNALIGSNTTAGDAITGQGGTSVNTQNIVGQNITGKNGILVFVNVLGRWVGMIVGPAQTTATITNTGPESSNVIGGGDSNNSLSVAAAENSLINNDINIIAESGDATVTMNTSAGNATTGDAKASINLVNIIGSNIDVSGFFGVLFINVFGNWMGSFGADTANGGFSQSPAAQGGRGGGSGGDQAVAAPLASASSAGLGGQVFGFAARTAGFSLGGSSGGSGQASGTLAQNAATNGDTTKDTNAVFGGSNTTPTDSGAASGANSVNVSAPQMNWWLIAGIIGLISTIMVLTREYFLALREERLAQS